MKTALVLVLLATTCLAGSLQGGFSTKQKRDDPLIFCNYDLSCSSNNNYCSTLACPACSIPLQDCLAKGPSCACYDTFFNCTSNKHDLLCDFGSFSAYFECEFSGLNCTCSGPNSTYTGPEKYDLCPLGSYCSDETALCATHKVIGAFCNDSKECGGSGSTTLFGEFDCINNKCALTTKALPGDACTTNNDCEFYANYSLGCVSGVCASQQVGQMCPMTTSYGYTCGNGLYCQNNSTCQKQVALGGSCDQNDENVCQGLAVCGYVGKGLNGSCVKIYSKAAGQGCRLGDECAAGLYCSEHNGVCMTMSGLPTTSCNYTSQCSGDQNECTCLNMKSVCQLPDDKVPVFAPCLDELAAYEKCVTANKCSFELTYNGCIENHCANEVECVYTCSINANNRLGPGYAACLGNVGGKCSASSATTAGTTGESSAVKSMASLAAIAGATALLL